VFNDRVVRRAFCIARSAHTGNYRQNGDPCLEKCVDIALVLADYGFGASVVAAGLLNDCIDDSMMTEDQLRNLFDDQIVDMVVGVGKMRSASALCSTSLGNLCEADLDRLRTMLLVMTDVNVMMIKLADQLRLLETMDGLPEAQVNAVVNETRQVCERLALMHRRTHQSTHEICQGRAACLRLEFEGFVRRSTPYGSEPTQKQVKR
jgi:GTP pyrophosphokinase